jgi:hypothetical protein
MLVGNVLKWNNFLVPKIGPIKPRWFIYFGDRSNMQDKNANVFLLSPTANVKRFQEHHKINSEYLLFHSGQYEFSKDCVINIYNGFYNNINEFLMKQYDNDIIVKGTIDNNKLVDIFNIIIRNHTKISIIEKDIIRLNLGTRGITNLSL